MNFKTVSTRTRFSIGYHTLRPREPRLTLAVYVHLVVTDFLCRFQKPVHDRRVRTKMFHAQVSAFAVILRVRELRYSHVLGLDKVRQHVLVAPTLVAGLVPCVVVLSVTSDVEHGVQNTAASDYFAAGPTRLIAIKTQT